MKRKTTVHCLAVCTFVIICLAFPGCRTEGTYICALIDGSEWNLADEPQTIRYRAEYNEIDNQLMVQGWSNNPEYVSGLVIQIANPGKGTHNLGKSSNNQARIWIIQQGKKNLYRTGKDSCDGMLRITEFSDTCVAGAFSYIATDDKGIKISLKKGKFRMPLDLLDF
ncbi:hypothetical protein GF359_07985 [candidate division WOR-3 bacterium]|uniref:Uncharacterized protein n=1 Tax=candidate division WOR-3 bacterium TaxID=2052148 RepID=A0A9D5KBP7_UNCW3|nr:hypothetical protein [candidate division WOR-3 bacterium]MBD3365140.1 hypothetical protein [candidate division WOR-3 bacterium]